MPAPDIIGPEPSSTPATLRSRGGSTRALPADLLREASRRLGILAVTGGTLWILGPVLERLARRTISPNDPSWRMFGVPDLIEGMGLLASVAMFWYTRRRDRNPQRVLDAGLFYLIFTGLLIGLIWHWQPTHEYMQVIPTITWVGVMMLMFSAMVPPNSKTS